MEKEQVSDKKINAFAKLLVHLDITRPYGDDVFDDPVKANELMRIGSERVELLEQIDKLDIATQKHTGKQYKEQQKNNITNHWTKPNYNRTE